MTKTIHRLLALLTLALLVALAPARTSHAQTPQPGWYAIPANLSYGCFDTLNPDVIWRGGIAYNWRSGQQLTDAYPISTCGPGGWVFGQGGGSTPAKRTRLGLNAAQDMAHNVQAWGLDGSLRVYSIDQQRLWVSEDAGGSWQERAQQFAGRIAQVVVAAADSRSIYILVVDWDKEDAEQARYAIYFSPDAGTSWEQRNTGTARGAGYGQPAISLWTPSAITAPVGVVSLTINPRYPGSSNRVRTWLSSDGARSWADEGGYGQDVATYYRHTHEGLLRVSTIGMGMVYGFQLSLDGGHTWTGLSAPSRVENPFVNGHRMSIYIHPTAPANVVVQDANGLWYSADGARSWRQIARPDEYGSVAERYLPVMTASMPLTLFRLRKGFSYDDPASDRYEALDIADAGRSTTQGVGTTGSSNGRFHPETRHNMAPVFVGYWERHGALAQFGHPKTEPFLEYNPADGKSYLVQYFERNRFEYHPEHAGTQYEVLLGLLGNQLTEARRNAGEGAFNRFADPRAPGQRYFPETGHTLRNAFRAYWEANGGLAIYGYPISEEFYEVNPDDGKTYVVQYFERARFEWHPENQGTRYEVLLGLLGTALLRDKGWPIQS